jgi:hypothetical protein
MCAFVRACARLHVHVHVRRQRLDSPAFFLFSLLSLALSVTCAGLSHLFVYVHVCRVVSVFLLSLSGVIFFLLYLYTCVQFIHLLFHPVRTHNLTLCRERALCWHHRESTRATDMCVCSRVCVCMCFCACVCVYVCLGCRGRRAGKF